MDNKTLEQVALSIRSLAMDGVETAKSGHPGLPMGTAELGALLYGELMSYYPKDPHWANRDRFVLSAGHGSMLLYALLHLSGFDLPLGELQRFRRVGSRTPGHPEYGHTVGVETTTGPLGQGVGNAVGFALAERMLAARFNTAEHRVVDHYTYVLASDGDIMEGVASEASSLAGHLKLGKLIVFYDHNKISIDGSTEIAFSEDVAARYRAYGWHTTAADMYDPDALRRATEEAKNASDRPSLISVSSVIGKGAPNKAGTAGVHGAPLGADERAAAKRALGLAEDQEFWVAPEAREFFNEYQSQLRQAYDGWQQTFDAWSKANPELREAWDAAHQDPGAVVERALERIKLPEFELGESAATRSVGGAVIKEIAKGLPEFVGGSADLAASNSTGFAEQGGEQSAANPAGRMIHYGIREHGMGAVTNGLALHGGLRPFAATFLIFSDYMRPSVRLAALMKLPVTYVWTHDSIFIGEDGPTHQPVEQLAALRAIPNLVVFRPGDAQETVAAWRLALLRTDGPCALVLTRQKLAVYAKHDANWRDAMASGAYVVRDSEGPAEVVLVATGSEVGLALAAAEQVDRPVRVVSMPSRELFLTLPQPQRDAIVPPEAMAVAVEAGVPQGWHEVVGADGKVFGIDRFGESGPGSEVAEHLGFTPERLAALIST